MDLQRAYHFLQAFFCGKAGPRRDFGGVPGDASLEQHPSLGLVHACNVYQGLVTGSIVLRRMMGMQARSGLHFGSSATRRGDCPPRVVASRIVASRVVPELLLILLLLFGLSAVFQASIAGGSESAVAEEALSVRVLRSSGPATGETIRAVDEVDGSVFAVEVKLGAQASEAGSVEIWVNGNFVESQEIRAGDSQVTFDLNTSEYSTGELSITVKTVDKNGRVVDEDSVDVQNTYPAFSATIIESDDGQKLFLNLSVACEKDDLNFIVLASTGLKISEFPDLDLVLPLDITTTVTAATIVLPGDYSGGVETVSLELGEKDWVGTLHLQVVVRKKGSEEVRRASKVATVTRGE